MKWVALTPSCHLKCFINLNHHIRRSSRPGKGAITVTEPSVFYVQFMRLFRSKIESSVQIGKVTIAFCLLNQYNKGKSNLFSRTDWFIFSMRSKKFKNFVTAQMMIWDCIYIGNLFYFHYRYHFLPRLMRDETFIISSSFVSRKNNSHLIRRSMIWILFIMNHHFLFFSREEIQCAQKLPLPNDDDDGIGMIWCNEDYR